jgi:hypothetical protein
MGLLYYISIIAPRRSSMIDPSLFLKISSPRSSLSDSFPYASNMLSNSLSPTPTGIPSRSPGANEVLRSKNKKRDEQIRKKVELVREKFDFRS